MGNSLLGEAFGSLFGNISGIRFFDRLLTLCLIVLLRSF